MNKNILIALFCVSTLVAQAQQWKVQGEYSRVRLNSYRTIGSTVAIGTIIMPSSRLGFEVLLGQTSIASLTNNFAIALQNELFQSWDFRAGLVVRMPKQKTRFFAQLSAGPYLRLATEYKPLQLFFERVPIEGGPAITITDRYLVEYQVNANEYVGAYAKAMVGLRLSPRWALLVPLTAETSFIQPQRSLQAYSAGLSVQFTVNPAPSR